MQVSFYEIVNPLSLEVWERKRLETSESCGVVKRREKKEEEESGIGGRIS